MKLGKLLVVLLGPQGVGKTTQALLLKKKLSRLGYRVTITESIYHTIILKIWYKLIITLTGRRIRYKFHPNGAIEEFVEPNMLKRMINIDFMINLISAVISALKIRLLSAIFPIVIEHEGFLYNQVAYLSFIYRKHMDIRTLIDKYCIFLRLIPKNALVIVLDVARLRQEDLQARYRRRGSLSEPWYYIKHQSLIYKALARLCQKYVILDAGMDGNSLSKLTTNFVLQSLSGEETSCPRTKNR